ncbi:MAG: ATP-dependent DNA helicase [Propionibacteriaceae bacterium]|nr:ATP-dependent DNA helicase [Propionibacteriaceae bacterium]
MTVHPIRRQLFTSEEQLSEALGIPFSREQLDCITAPLEPAVIIAGAGSGKTTVMAARVVWLVGTGQVRPDEVLGLTFTRKAAAELAGRVSDALMRAGVLAGTDGEGAELVMTYDSFAARLVSEFGLRIGIDKDPVMITGASRFRLATRVVADAPGPFRSISRLSHHSIPERVLTLDAEMASHLVDPADVLRQGELADQRFREAPLFRGKMMRDVARAMDATAERRELVSLVLGYQELKRKLGVVEFADQLREAVRLVTEAPEVGRELRSRFKVVLLDEYQDTSSAQSQLLRALFTGPVTSSAMGFPVTAVGDPYQAIYGWRGAASGNILEFPYQFRRSDGAPAERQTLSINRRSGHRILEVGNRLAAGLHAAPGEEGVSLVAPEGAPAGSVLAATFDTFRDEVDWLAEHVIAQHDSGTPWKEQAVLVRRNAALAPIFEALRERDVPVEIVGLGGLLTLPEIGPIVATLRVLDDVTANPSVAALLTGPRWNLGLADMEALGARARQLAAQAKVAPSDPDALVRAVTQADPGEVVSLLDAVADPADAPLSSEARRRLARFHGEITALRRHISEPVADLVTRVISSLGLESELIASGRDTSQVARFVAEVASYVDVDGDGSLTGLLAYLDAESDHGEGLLQAVPSEDDSVKLMTVHRAKGLEWDTVFLPSLADKVFPSESRSGVWPQRADTLPAMLRGDADSVPQLGEYTKKGIDAYREALRADHRLAEDRLAYVAATRAKRLLIASTHTWTPENIRPRGESPYFEVIRDLCEAAGTYLDARTRDEATNPIPAEPARAAWPVELDAATLIQRAEATQLIEEAASVMPLPEAQREAWIWESGVSSAEDAATVAQWDDSIRHLAELAQRRGRRTVELPDGLSATALMALRSDRDGFAAGLMRRMPRRPSTAARMGSRFHEWLQERFLLPASLEEVEPVTGAAPPELAALIRAFESGQFATRTPLGVEVPFLMRRGPHELRGRIDAVYRWQQDGFAYLVVDWKTSNQSADPLQLAVYRQAWAEARGVDPATVGAAFYHVLTDQLRLVDAPAELIDQALKMENP